METTSWLGHGGQHEENFLSIIPLHEELSKLRVLS